MSILVNDKLPLNLQLEGGDSNKFPLSFVYDQTGTQVPGSPFILTHIDNGLYLNRDYTVRPGDSKLFAVYITYKDSLHTIVDTRYFPRSEEMFDVDQTSSQIMLDIDDIKTYLASVIDTGKLEGIVTLDEDLIGIVADEDASGIIDDSEPLIGILDEEDINGNIALKDNINGVVDL